MRRIALGMLMVLPGLSCGGGVRLEDPSFEHDGAWTGSSSCSFTAGAVPCEQECTVTREEGLGFMPTDGVSFLQLRAASTFTGFNVQCAELTAFQDGVEISSSSTLRFDVAASSTGDPVNATASILLTGDGTTTLWTQAITQEAVELRDQVVELAGVPEAGRLTIRLVTASPTEAFVNATTILQLDNLRTD